MLTNRCERKKWTHYWVIGDLKSPQCNHFKASGDMAHLEKNEWHSDIICLFASKWALHCLWCKLDFRFSFALLLRLWHQ